MVTTDHRGIPESGDLFWCVYAGRRDVHDYTHSHQEILDTWGSRVVMALGTAAEVSSSYVYVIGSAVVQAIAYACIGITCAAYILPVAPASSDAPILHRRPVRCAAAAALCLIALGCFVTIPQYGSDFGVYLNHWDAMPLTLPSRCDSSPRTRRAHPQAATLPYPQERVRSPPS